VTEPVAGEQKLAIVLNRDLMFGSRIRGALKMLGLEARFVSDTEGFMAALATEAEVAAIGILDMNGEIDWETFSTAMRDAADAPPTLAFGPHVDVENRRAAKAAGVTRLVSNGQFHSDMAALIERYRRR
jgi:methylmalonyl-CoA mutase cobalamin-binding subunit